MQGKILIASEPNSPNSDFIKLLKTKLNQFEILNAQHSIEACRAAASEFPDLILIDYNPLFASQIIEKIKSDVTTKHLPLVAIFKKNNELHNNNLDDYTDFIHSEMNLSEIEFRIKHAVQLSLHLKKITQIELKTRRMLITPADLEQIAFQTSNAIAIIDKQGIILWINDIFRQKYNSPLFEPDGKTTIYDFKTEEELKSNIENCFTDGKVVQFNTAIDRGDWQDWLRTTLNPAVKNGKTEWIAIIEDDITKLKETELELEQKSEHMLSLTEYLENANNQLEAQKQEIDHQREALEEEKQKYEKLLGEILPFEVARQLLSKGEVKPKSFKMVTVMFTDFKGFSKISANLPPEELVKILHGYFARFDDIISKHFIEKIKTIGDAYMCVGGLPLRNKSNPFNVVLAGIEIQKFMNELNDKLVVEGLPVWELRLGIHTGEVVAGVVGKKKFAYDIWGDTVNIAARMETSGHVGMVNISGATYEHIKDHFECTYRGAIEVKNRGEIDMYFVQRIKPEFSVDGKGFEPNEDFIRFLNKL